MRIIVDTNLPPSLAEWLRSEGVDAHHTSEFGFETAKDRDIWRRARDEGAVIVSKDEDFVWFRANDASGPRVVWVRFGNTIRRVLLQRFVVAWPAVVARLEAGDGVVEIR